MSQDGYFDWLDASLKADFRAVGGETCRVCVAPVPEKAHWKHRDRHVCSSRCNGLLIRRFKAKVGREELVAQTRPRGGALLVQRESKRAPRLFRTLPEAIFPYEHARFPVLGDIIERHGAYTHYVALDSLPWRGTFVESVVDNMGLPAEAVLGAVHAETGAWSVWFRNADGSPRPTTLGRTIHGDFMYETWSRPMTFENLGDVYTHRELISDVEDAEEFRWEALVFSPVAPEPLWTPARTALSQQRGRATRARSAYQARMRALGVVDAEADRVDPFAIYDRDGWVCQICQKAIDRHLTWPDPHMATLDHVRAVTLGGAHNEANLQAAHWLCNVVKGNKS